MGKKDFPKYIQIHLAFWTEYIIRMYYLVAKHKPVVLVW